MTEIPETLPDKPELERQQLYLANEKLKLEARKMEREVAPDKWWSKLAKNAVAIGGVVTVAVTIYGAWDSYDKTIKDREHTRVAEARVRFEDATKRLESPSTISKLVGVSVLSGYLDKSNSDLHRQVLFTLAGLMATEKDQQTQRAVIDLMTGIPKDGPIKQEDWAYFQDILVSQSQALMAKGELLRKRSFRSDSPVKDEEQAAQTLGKLIAINIRKGVVPGYVNYRGIYCAHCDFHGASFPKGVDFTGAVLDGANFSGASLQEALLDDAELLGTTFVEANLRQARLRSLQSSLPFARTEYLDHIANLLNVWPTINILMPNFSCANLEGADFDEHALFPGVIALKRVYAKSDRSNPGWYQNVPDYLRNQVEFSLAEVLQPPKFLKANLASAKFDKSRYFSFTEGKDAPNEGPRIFMKFARSLFHEVVALWQGDISDSAFQISKSDNSHAKPGKADPSRERKKQVDTGLDDFQRRMRAAFYMAVLDHASLPENLSDFLRKSEPTPSDFDSTFGSTWGKDPDMDCTPKRN